MTISFKLLRRNRYLRTRPFEEPLVASNSPGLVFFLEVQHSPQSERSVGGHHFQLGDNLLQNFSWVQWERVLSKADFLVCMTELYLKTIQKQVENSFNILFQLHPLKRYGGKK